MYKHHKVELAAPGGAAIVVGFSKEKEVVSLDYDKRGTGVKDATDYGFDKVFRPESTQVEVFDEVQPYVSSCMDGYHVSIFA